MHDRPSHAPPPTTGRAPAPGEPAEAHGLDVRYRHVSVDALVAEIPPVVVPTTQIEARIRPLYRKLGFKSGWVEAVTGIAERRMWAEGETALDAATRAAQRALDASGVGARDIGVLINGAVYKPRLEPSLASEIQGRLGIGRQCANFDVSNACLGFLTGLVQAANMIELGQIGAALVVAAEDARPVVSSTLDTLRAADADIHAFKDNLATLTLGSAAAAAVLTRSPSGRPARPLLGGSLAAATEHHDLCVGDDRGMLTDSVRLLREGVRLAGFTWAEVRRLFGWQGDEVDSFAMHQVGKTHHETIVRHLGVPEARAPQIYPWMGNVGAAGVPVTAALSRDQGVTGPGDTVALMGIGSGLNCMMLGVTW